MSQGSPSKQDRIEKHLARQRGAGARNLTTSFGFSFGLQPATVEQQDHEHPPAKRRKSVRPQGTETVKVSVAHYEGDTKTPRPRTTRQTATKRKQPRRFELPSDDDKLETVATRSSATQEDSFLVAKKKTARRGRPKKNQSATPNDDADKPKVGVQEVQATTVKKRGRPKKAASTPEEHETADVVDSGDAIKQSTEPIKKRGRPPKALAAAGTVPLAEPTSMTPESTKPANATIPVSEYEDVVRLELSTETLVLVEHIKPSIKKRGWPREAQLEQNEPPAEVKPCSGSLMSISEAKRVSKAKDARRGHHYTGQVVAQPDRRPRRQAAATAMSKVSEGFIEEEAPIDEKRRDPELTPGRGRKKLAAPALSNDASNSGTKGDLGASASMHDNFRDQSDCVNDMAVSAHELPTQPSAPVDLHQKRSCRSKARPKVLPHPLGAKSEILPDTVVMRDPSTTKRVPLSEAPNNTAIQTPSPEKPGKGTKAARNTTQARLADVDQVLTTTRNTQVTQAVSKKPTLAKPRVSDIEKEHQREESTSQRPGCCPKAFASGFAKVAEHRVPEASVAADKRRRDGRERAQDAPTVSSEKDNRDVAGSSRKCRNAPRHDQPATGAASLSEPSIKPVTSRKTDTTTDGSHSLDWLFEKSRERQPPAAEKKPVSKRRVYKDEEANAAEMDLDDLLSNIAAFVPKSTTA